MKNIVAVFYVCLAVVTCQSPSRPPPPPSNDLTKPSLPETPKKDPSAQVYPPRPKGCSPGCGPTEICAELGASYCRLNEACSVCIKMSSIRFPASALAGMFSQQKPQAAVPAQELPVQQGPDSPFGPGAEETYLSVAELTSHQRGTQDTLSNEFGRQGSKGFPPRPPPVDENLTVRPVNELDPVIKPINDGQTLPTANPFGTMATDVKYPIVATVHEPAQHIHEAQVSLSQGHLDQMHQQYTQGNVQSNLSPAEQKAAEFDFISFKRYQAWLKQQQVPAEQSAAEEFALFQKYRQWVKEEQTNKASSSVDTSVSNNGQQEVSSTSTQDATSKSASSTLPPFDYAAFKQQWQKGDLATKQGVTGTAGTPTVLPPSGKEASYLDYATIQRMWQQQQQQLDQVYQQQPQQLDQVYQVNPNTPTHVSYVPQQPVVNNYNDPFDIFGFNDPIPPQQNQVQNNIQVPMNNNNINSNQGVNAHNNDPLFGLMMFEGLGFGGGFGLGF